MSREPNADGTGGKGTAGAPPAKPLTTRQAAFIGVGSMVGAGIFALLGAAGAVAGAAVWLSFLLAGVVAALQGYSFAKFGARYPTAGGMLEYVAKGFGNGHFTGVTAWLTFAANSIVTAMVAVSFGSYASSMMAGGNEAWAKVFAVLIILVMTGVNIVGSRLVAGAQSIIVYVVLGMAAGLCERLAETGQFPPLMARKAGGRASSGLLIQAVSCVVLVVAFKLDAIASIGSAVALLVFTLITVAHLRVRHETGASPVMLWLAIATAGVVLVSFVITTLVSEPASIVTLLGILVLAIGLDRWWKRVRDHRGQAGIQPRQRGHGVMEGTGQ